MLLDYHSLSSAVSAAVAVSLACTATLSAGNQADAPVSASLTATATLSADTVSAYLAAFCSVLADAGGYVSVSADLAATGLLDASASISGSLGASLPCSATVTASAVSYTPGAVALTCTASVTARPLYTVPVAPVYTTIARRSLIGGAVPTHSQIVNLKSGATSPTLQVQLFDSATNAPVDLTAVSRIDFRLYSDTSPRVATRIGQAAIVGSPANGTVKYFWTSPDTETPGDYLAEFRVAYAAGGYELMPETSFIRVRISEDLT